MIPAEVITRNPEMAKPDDNWQKALKLGLFYTRPAGIQININPAFDKQGHQGDFCDHECAELKCPARMSVNRGLITTSMAPAEKIIKAVEIGAKGLRQYVSGDFIPQFEEMGFPLDVQTGMIGVCREGPIEVNVFGGNPELHPNVFEIIKQLKGQGYPVNLTTTGGRLFGQDFALKMVENPPDVLAMSLEQKSASDLEELLGLTQNQLRDKRQAISPAYGEKRKAIEAIHGANMALEDPRMPNVLFNWVIDGTNVSDCLEMASLVRQKYGTRARVNLYPIQMAPFNLPPVMGPEQLEKFEQVVDVAIDWHLNDEMRKFVSPRLHTFLAWKGVFNAYRGDYETTAKRLSGEQFWRCYADPRAGRYLQIGKGATDQKFEHPGGMLSCFWKEDAINNPRLQVWDTTPEAVRHHITQGMKELSQASFNEPCQGCTMPRLVFDAASLIAGMADQNVLREYLILQKEYLGF